MMKIIVTVMLGIAPACACAQENESGFQQQLEQQAAQEENEIEDDSYLLYLEQRAKHRLNINACSDDDLRELNMLTALQIHNLVQYRSLLGQLVSIYELQAIPGWDIATIRTILPYITIQNELPGNWKNFFREGEHRILLRLSQILEKADGYTTNHYLGSPLKILTRFKYQFRDQLQYGITADKDAGEQFFRRRQGYGFDFYSFHFFVRKIGTVKALAIGDFIINFGQGLIHWQGQAFKKSSLVLNTKRQSPALKPYTAAGEYNFHRGAAITLQRGAWQTTLFSSTRKWSASIQQDELGNNYLTSIQSSGLHRANTELQNKNSTTAIAAGANIQYRQNRGHISLNTIYHNFSIPFRSSGKPYDIFALSGNNWLNASIDYGYTWQNLHAYGEIAIDKNFNRAMLHGLLSSLHPSLDLAVVYRHIPPAYQAVASNAFTESSTPTNENGLYAGLSARPAQGWRIDAYADFFRFPWLKYRVDQPSAGTDYLLQVTYTPDKQTELYTRCRTEKKETQRTNWRTHVSFQINKQIHLQNRIEILWQTLSNEAFLFFHDIQFTPANRPWKASIRFQYFESGNYDSRLYAFENSVMYSFSMPAFFNKGIRYYINFQQKFLLKHDHQKIHCTLSFNISRTDYAKGTIIGSTHDRLPGSGKTELKSQVIFYW